MNSLEFIEKEIELCKQEIEENRRNYEIRKLKRVFYVFRNLDLRKRLRTLHQIKAELEAWEVVKEKAEIIEVVTTVFPDPSYAKETTPTLPKLVNSEPVEIRISIVGKDRIEKFKKALEVGEND